MKLITISIVLAASAAALPDEFVYTPGCTKLDGDLNPAINRFCNKTNAAGQFTNDIVVPSQYANTGVTVGQWMVKITGSCKPEQWVPADVCAEQFHQLCDGGEQYAIGFNGWKQGGSGECQTWIYGQVAAKP